MCVCVLRALALWSRTVNRRPRHNKPGLIRVKGAATVSFVRLIVSEKGSRLYSCKSVFRGKITWGWYGEGFRGSKGIKEPRIQKNKRPKRGIP